MLVQKKLKKLCESTELFSGKLTMVGDKLDVLDQKIMNLRVTQNSSELPCASKDSPTPTILLPTITKIQCQIPSTKPELHALAGMCDA